MGRQPLRHTTASCSDRRQVERRASIGYPPAANARPAVDDVDSPNALKGNRLCQCLRSPCAVSPSPSWAWAPLRLSPRERTSRPSILTPVSACRAGRYRNMAHRRPIRSSTLLVPPADRPSIPGGVAEQRPPIPSPPLPPASSPQAMSPPATYLPACRRPCTATIPAPTCLRRRPDRSRVGSWPFPNWGMLRRHAAATRPRRPPRRRLRLR